MSLQWHDSPLQCDRKPVFPSPLLGYRVYISYELHLGRLACEPTASGVPPKPPAGDEARPPHPLCKVASVRIKGVVLLS